MKKLQYKFVLNILLISTLPLAILATITIISLHRIAISEAHKRINNNLNIARIVYQGICDNLRYLVEGQNQRVCSLIETNRVYLLRKELKMLAIERRLDFFILTDDAGKVIVSVSNPFLVGADFSKEYFVRKALTQNRTFVSTEITPEEELRRIGIIKKAKITGISDQDTMALVIRVVAPIVNRDQVVIGTMSAGYLLNNNSFVVDKITETTKYFSSIFLEGKRISTNLPYPVGKFALGSSIGGELAKNILEENNTHIGRIQIVNQWYISGYSPLYNYNRESVGILAVAIPEYTIFVLRDKLILLSGFVVILSIILAFMLGVLNASRIVNHINKLHKGIEAFATGKFDYRIKINSGDEIEELGKFFNLTMSQLEESRKHVIDLRREIRKSSEQLELTQQQLFDYEKMAAMGKMATAINHELKNAFAQIQTSISFLRSKQLKDSPKLNEYLEDIENGVNYANDVLANLLRLSHPKKLILSNVDLNFLLEDLLSSPNLREMIKDYGIEVIRDLDRAMPKIKADGLQVREVFRNLITNSAQAMQGGGKLTVISRVENGYLRIEVNDTGGGIAEHNLENVFTPFFTTKSKGIGLGLCIGKDIIEAHKGTIEFKTDSATYTTFIVRVPAIATV